GSLVDLAGLDAHQSVLDDVDPADALGAGATVHLLDGLQRGDLAAVDRDGHAALEGDDDFVGDRRERRVIGVAEDVLGGFVPDVLEEAGLDGASPHVLVDRERVVLGGLDGQALALGVLDGLVTGQGEVAHRGDALQLGSERGDRDLEADLVVALAGAAVGDGAGAELLRRLDQVLGDHRAGDRRDVRVGVHVQRVGLERRHAVLLGELVAGVGDVGLDGAAVQGALADHLEILSALAAVHRAGDDIGAGGVVDPADGHGGGEAAGEGEDDAVGHCGLKASLLMGSSLVVVQAAAAQPASWSSGWRIQVGEVASASRLPSAISSSRAASRSPPSGSRATSSTVSSPAIVPITSGITERSSAEARYWAPPGGVRTTTRLALASAETSRPSASRGRRASSSSLSLPGPAGRALPPSGGSQ